MAVRTDWKVTFYGASADPSPTQYQSIAASSISSPTTQVVYVVQPQPGWEVEFNELVAMDGHIRQKRTIRRAFDLNLYPFSFIDSSTEPDLTDLDNLVALLESNFLWVRVETTTRTYPSTVGHVIPVVLTGYERSVNAESGYHIATVSIRHREFA